MNINLNLKDSQFIEGKGEKIADWYNTGVYCQAVDKLNHEIAQGNIQTYSLSKNKNVKIIDKKFIWYEIEGSRNSNSNYVITNASFYSSHYIGFYSTKIKDTKKNEDTLVNITINPRFGNESKLFNYLLSYAYGIYIPKGNSSYKKEQNNNYWLMAVLWKASLEKALTKSQIPKEYQKVESNIRVFKGKLKISQQIKRNLVDSSRFYCEYRKFSMDTTINRTIRYLYNVLTKKGFKNLLKSIAEYDAKLDSFGVQSQKVSIEEINNIRYSKLNIHYRQVMQISKMILSNLLASSDANTYYNNSFAYFIDISELWENYLLKVLQRNLSDYEVYSPNERGGEYLFENRSREIRPDIIIKKNGVVTAVLDAKYKWYERIGKTSEDYTNVSRDDLYQMIAYLYHFGENNDKIIGLFISPVEEMKNDLLNLSIKPNHKIGVLNLNINQWVDSKKDFSVSEMKSEEKKFIDRLKLLLPN